MEVKKAVKRVYVHVCMYVCKERRVGKGNELVKQG